MQYTRQHQLMWVVFIISSLMALPLSYYLFSRAIPLVNISLTMNRSQALEKAEVIHRTLFSCTRHTQDTAFFYNDSSVQLFVELEGGGKEAFKKLITDNIYHPYRWLVRQFEAGNPEETQISLLLQEGYSDLKKHSQKTARAQLSLLIKRALSCLNAYKT